MASVCCTTPRRSSRPGPSRSCSSACLLNLPNALQRAWRSPRLGSAPARTATPRFSSGKTWLAYRPGRPNSSSDMPTSPTCCAARPRRSLRTSSVALSRHRSTPTADEHAVCSDVSDADPCVRLVPAVDGHQVRGQRLDLAAIAQPAAVYAAHAWDFAGQRDNQVSTSPIVAQDEDVEVHGVNLGVKQKLGRHMVERTDDGARGQYRRCLLRGAALGHPDRVRATGVKADGIDAVNNDLAGQRTGELAEQIRVTLPRNRRNQDVCFGGGLVIQTALDERTAAEVGRR